MKKFRNMLSRFKTYFKSNYTQLLKYLLIVLFGSTLFFSNVLLSSNIKNNIPGSVMEIEEKLKSGLGGEQPYCIVYPKETTNYTNMAYRDPEKSAEVRSIFDGIQCFDWYLDYYNSNYKPFIYDFDDGSSTYLSLSMFPKKSYVQSSFFYDISLVAGHVNNINNPFDIFINQSFADKLINSGIFNSTNNYNDLIGKKITSLSKIKTNTILTDFYIAGVIKNDELYKKYSNVFGEFAIVSEYFSIPMPCATYVEMFDNSFKNYNLVKTLLSIYKFESNYSSVGVGERVFPIEYRTYFHKQNELISVQNKNVIKCNTQIDEVFDYYFQNKNLIPIITLIVLIVTLVFSFIFYARSKNTTSFKARDIVCHLLCFLIAMPLGSLIANAYKMIFKKTYSIANPLSLLFYIAFLIIFVCVLFLKYRKGKINESRNH